MGGTWAATGEAEPHRGRASVPPAPHKFSGSGSPPLRVEQCPFSATACITASLLPGPRDVRRAVKLRTGAPQGTRPPGTPGVGVCVSGWVRVTGMHRVKHLPDQELRGQF